MAWEKMKREPGYRERGFLTYAEYDRRSDDIIDRIPWRFTGNHADHSRVVLRKIKRNKYGRLKRLVGEIKEILDGIELEP